MKNLLFSLVMVCGFAVPASAWEGFDAETTDLVSLSPDQVPSRGDTVEVHNYDKEKYETCVIEHITLNTRTMEVIVRMQDGTLRTLVMEGR